jgi:DNA-binding transcriptional ArsR family regulator
LLNLAAVDHERYGFLPWLVRRSASASRARLRKDGGPFAGDKAIGGALDPRVGLHPPSPPLFVYKRTVEIDRLLVYYSFMRMPLHPAKSQITLPNVLFALSDPTRLQIVKAIAKNDNINCCDIQIDLSKSTASRHFRVLREAGVIRMEPRGIVCLNSLRRDELDELFPGLLDSVLRATEPARPRSRAAAKVS